MKNILKNRKRDFLLNHGITGLAQVRVRNSATWDERIEIDREYLKNITFKNDFTIILKTLKSIFKKQNIYQSNNEMEKKENVNI